MSRVETVEATDGYVLSYRVWDATAPRATVFMFGGVMSHAEWFTPIASPLVDSGLRLVGVDRRGSGLNTVGRGDAPDATTVVDDALAVFATYDEPRFLLGWCWGAILALNVLRRLDSKPAGVVLATPGLYPSAAVVAAAKMNRATAGDGAADEAVVQMPIEERMFTVGPQLESFIHQDDVRLRTMTRRFADLMPKLAFGAASTVRRLDVPTLVLLASDDLATDNAAATKALAGRATIETIDSAHGIQLEAPDAMAASILRFVEAQLVS